jgi:hypothetical protein
LRERIAFATHTCSAMSLLQHPLLPLVAAIWGGGTQRGEDNSYCDLSWQAIIFVTQVVKDPSEADAAGQGGWVFRA